MFLNPENLLNDIKSTTLNLSQITDYYIFEIFVTRKKLIFEFYDTDEYIFQLCSKELFRHLENICKLKIYSFCFSNSNDSIDIDIYGKNLHINIINLETIRLKNIYSIFNESRDLKSELKDDIISYLRKEFPVFFTI